LFEVFSFDVCDTEVLVILREALICFQAQKERVKTETAHSKKLGLAIRLLPPSKEDQEEASRVKFAHKFEHNRKLKRAAINSSSIFSQSSVQKQISCGDLERKLQLVAKKRRINGCDLRSSVMGNIKPLSGSAVSSSRYVSSVTTYVPKSM
jgi:coiled-coil domain-containing protein 130